MRILHIGLWTNDIERCEQFYTSYFGAVAGEHYFNPAKGFESCFLSLEDGAQIELMKTSTLSPVVIERGAHRMGLTHIGINLESERKVDALAEKLRSDGYPILDGPRRTGDGFYECVILDPEGNRIELVA